MYLLEVGVVLSIVPWTTYWDRNYFVESLPALQGILTAPTVRGGLTGVGLLCLGAAVLEVAAVVRRRLAGGSTRTGRDDRVLADPSPPSRIV